MAIDYRVRPQAQDSVKFFKAHQKGYFFACIGKSGYFCVKSLKDRRNEKRSDSTSDLSAPDEYCAIAQKGRAMRNINRAGSL